MRRQNIEFGASPHIKGKEAVLGIIVVYDKNRSSKSITRFNKFLTKNYSNFEIRIISNNDELSGHIMGSNVCGEFSGWSEGLLPGEVDKYSIFIFANDTFESYGRFEGDAESKFADTVSKANHLHNKFIVGEVCWHVDYLLAKQRQYFLIKWIRTSIFAISSDALRDIKGVGLTKTKIDELVKNDANKGFQLSASLPQVVRKRIDAWLCTSKGATGWHSAGTATQRLLLLKAKCVLQEILLIRRCMDANVAVYDYKKIDSRKQLVLRCVFYIQNIILKF